MDIDYFNCSTYACPILQAMGPNHTRNAFAANDTAKTFCQSKNDHASQLAADRSSLYCLGLRKTMVTTAALCPSRLLT